MTRPLTLRERASGELGLAIVERMERDGYTSTEAFAKRLGFGREAVSRWIRNDKTPSAEAAEALCTLYPDLRQLLVAKGCFTEKERKRPPLGKRAQTRKQARGQRAERMRDVERARARAAEPDLPWPSDATREQRRAALSAAIRRRKRRERAITREANRAEPWYPRRVSHTGDFAEGLTDIVGASVGFATSYEMEGM